MASAYCYSRPITNTGTISSTEKTISDWESEFGDMPVLGIEDTSGNIHDYSEFIAEFSVVHNDIDGEKAGRDKTTGKMVRVYVDNKHTLNIKMVNKLPSVVTYRLFRLISSTSSKQSFWVRYQSPCANTIARKEVYCSTINYGAQRYDRKTGKSYYDGMNFNLIEM